MTRSIVMRALSPLLLGALLLPLAGCGSGDNGGGRTVSATTGVLAEITERIAGDDVTVEQIVPDSSSPHDFQLSAEDRARIEDSVLLVSNGADLEAGIPVADIDAPPFVLAEHAGPLRRFSEPGAHADEHGEEHGGADPHLWMDPTRVAKALPALAGALAEADPEHAEDYRRRARSFAAELDDLDAELRRELAAVPEQNRELVTSHDSLGYFADRYGFTVVATPFGAAGPEGEPSAADVKAVEEAIRRTRVPAVFAQQDDDPEVLRRIADATGVEIIDDLVVESPADTGGYAEMLRHDAERIRSGLG